MLPYIAKRFDDRTTDFHTGRKVSPPVSARKTCDCCGMRIVKGAVLSDGSKVGEDCADLINRCRSDMQSGVVSTPDEFAVRYKRATGWAIKPAAMRFLDSFTSAAA